MQATDEVGSAQWARDRLHALAADDDWSGMPACSELIDWLYPVALHRARTSGVPRRDLLEVAQDAMPWIVRALRRSAPQIASALNPAAVLERIVERAVAAATHRLRMAGLGGVQPNGRHWHKPYPTIWRYGTAARLLETIQAVEEETDHAVEDVADQLAEWVTSHLSVVLTDEALHAVVYVLDRLLARVGRAALVRGAHAGLSGDPAMRHLGFDAAAAGAFARWLLGRADAGHKAPALLDAFLDANEPKSEVLTRWRDVAVEHGFARELASVTNLPPTEPRPARRIA